MLRCTRIKYSEKKKTKKTYPRRNRRGDPRDAASRFRSYEYVDGLAFWDDTLGVEPVDASDVERGECGRYADLLRDYVVKVGSVWRVHL